MAKCWTCLFLGMCRYFLQNYHTVCKNSSRFTPILWQERRVLMEKLHTVASSATPLRNELICPKNVGA